MKYQRFVYLALDWSARVTRAGLNSTTDDSVTTGIAQVQTIAVVDRFYRVRKYQDYPYCAKFLGDFGSCNDEAHT